MNTTPPHSSDKLFFSSPSAYDETGLTEQIASLLAQARKVEQLDPIFDAVVTSNTNAFFDSFQRRVGLIKSRMQAFEACHVTVFDKVLLNLTENGSHLNSNSAIAYYFEEFLGIPAGLPIVREQEVLSNMLHVSVNLGQETTTSPDLTGWTSHTAIRSPPSPMSDQFPGNGGVWRQGRTTTAVVGHAGDEVTNRILQIYRKAKNEFYDLADQDSLGKQTAAKFLRDTIENALHHLVDKSGHSALIDEMNETLTVAKNTAVALSGGKKRKFDPVILRERDRYVPLPRSPERRIGSAYSDRKDAAKRQNDKFGGYIRAHEQRDGIAEREGRCIRTGPHFTARDYSPPRRRDGKRARKQPGRGHSGVPFGYTRVVDSYQPPA